MSELSRFVYVGSHVTLHVKSNALTVNCAVIIELNWFVTSDRLVDRWIRACLHGGGGPQVGEVTRLAVVEKCPAFTCKLTTPGPRGDVTRRCCVVDRHVNRENGGRTTHFGGQYSFPLITLYLLSLQHFSAVAFYCHFWWFGALANVTWTRPQLGGYPTLSRLHCKMWHRLTGLPYLADRATRLGGFPHLSCEHDQIKMRNYMERRVTPPRRVTSPTWGPPPPCKQALSRSTIIWHFWRCGESVIREREICWAIRLSESTVVTRHERNLTWKIINREVSEPSGLFGLISDTVAPPTGQGETWRN